MSARKKTELATIPLAELVEDMDLYPRHAVDSAHVQGLVFALQSGATLPPIVADKRSKRVTDGWHRRRAQKRFLGAEGAVEVELIDYAGEAEMKLDAARRNAQHGRHLDAIDRTRCVLMLRASGFDDAQIAGALNVPEKRVEKLAIRVAAAPKGSVDSVPGTRSIVLKRSVQHMNGQRLTKSQAQAHSMLPGTSFLLITKQLCQGLAENMVNLEDERLVAQLEKLRSLLDDKLGAGVAA